MTDGWQVGDLALCVNDGPIKTSRGGVWRGEVSPRKGEISKVVAIEPALYDDGEISDELALRLDTGKSGVARRFRKIKPDTEPCEEEFTVLIKRGRRVQA